MVWTTFAALGAGPATPNELDANLQILTYLAPVACSISGTNSLTLTPTNAGAPLTAFQTNMQFTGIVLVTNSGPVVASVVGFPGSQNVYKDTLSGPVLLVGGELVANCAATFRYDQALNGGMGGFHLQGGGGASIGTTLSVASLITGALSASGVANLTTLNAVAGGVTLGVASIVTASVSGVLSTASVSFAGGDPLIRLNSSLTSLVNVTLTPAQISLATVPMTGAAIGDAIHINQTGALAFGSLSFRGYVPASGSVIVAVQNPLTATTITIGSLNYRIVDWGFAT